MREAPNPKVERFRLRERPLYSNSTYGNNGAFRIPHPSGILFYCIVSDGAGWDHVSVQTLDAGKSRIPTWNEMEYVKALFFDDDETVMQLHVPTKDHLNLHPSVLHLWRPQKVSIPRPPSQMVAPKDNDEWRRVLSGESILPA